MTTYDGFMKGVYDWIVLNTGFDAANVFRQNQENPDLGAVTEWATYQEISGVNANHPLEKKTANETNPTEQVDYTRITPGEAIVSVNIYAKDGADILRGLWASNNERATREIFKTAKVVLFRMSGPREINQLSNTRWKHRYQADFTFRLHTERVETDYIADIFDLDGKMNDDTVNIYVDRNG